MTTDQQRLSAIQADEEGHAHHFLDADRTGTKCILCGQYRHVLYPDERSNCSTPGAIYSVGCTNAHTIDLRVDLPFPIDVWVGGRFAVTDGPKVKRYEQAYTERQRISDLFHDALEPAIAQVYAEHGRSAKSPPTPKPEALSREGGEIDEAAERVKFEANCPERQPHWWHRQNGRYVSWIEREWQAWLARAQIAHTELTEARKRIAELEATLIVARDTFDYYGDLHAAKPDPVKASRNYELAKQMGSLITPTTGEGM